jgi:hypothetical protein
MGFICDTCEAATNDCFKATINEDARVKILKLCANLRQDVDELNICQSCHANLMSARYPLIDLLTLNTNNPISYIFSEFQRLLYKAAKKKDVQPTQAEIDNPEQKAAKKVYFEKCKYCLKSFNKETHLTAHIKRVHNTGERDNPQQVVVKNIYSEKCKYCFRTFESKANLAAHIRRQHKVSAKGLKEVKLFECDECFKLFSQKSKLTDHKKSHAPKPTSKICNQCGLVLNPSERLGDHIRQNHPVNQDVYDIIKAHIDQNQFDRSQIEQEIIEKCGQIKQSNYFMNTVSQILAETGRPPLIQQSISQVASFVLESGEPKTVEQIYLELQATYGLSFTLKYTEITLIKSLRALKK